MVDKKTFYDLNSSLLIEDESVKKSTGIPNEAIATPLAINQGDTIMADVDTSVLASQHADIRREAAEHRASIQLEDMKGFDRVNADVLKSGWAGVDATKDARHDVNSRIADTRESLNKSIDMVDDTLTAQASNYFIANQQYQFDAARDVAALKATTDMGLQKLGQDIVTQGALGQAAAALQAEKIASAVALGQSILSKEIFHDGQRTRDLINDLKYHDLNRALVERNAELVEERHERRGYRDRADQFQAQGQWAALQSQIQAFQSQLQTATQGTVNFGTMSGNAGRNTSTNNVA